MSEFKQIETQEQLDAVIGDRLARERTKLEEKFKAYISPDELSAKMQGLNDQIADLSSQLTSADAKYKELEKTVAEKDAAIKQHETASVKSRVAHEIGLPYEAISFLQGEDEDGIKKSAEQLKSMFGKNFVPPLANPEPRQETDKTKKDNEMKALLKNLRGDN